jgi:hypothetical protein
VMSQNEKRKKCGCSTQVIVLQINNDDDSG